MQLKAQTPDVKVLYDSDGNFDPVITDLIESALMFWRLSNPNAIIQPG